MQAHSYNVVTWLIPSRVAAGTDPRLKLKEEIDELAQEEANGIARKIVANMKRHLAGIILMSTINIIQSCVFLSARHHRPMSAVLCRSSVR